MMLLDGQSQNTDFACQGPLPHLEMVRKHQDSLRVLSRAGECIQEHMSKLEQRYQAKLVATLERPDDDEGRLGLLCV